MASHDVELAAMRAILDVLYPLDAEQRVRVLASVICLYDLTAAKTVLHRWRLSCSP